MPIFKINDNNKLIRLKDKDYPNEKYLQKLVEFNLDELFGLIFVSGASNKEFSVKGQHQTFYIDTLAYDPRTNSFVIIEYKKDKNFSVVDQGLAYLAAMLNNKADFILEYYERLSKSVKKEEVNWTQSKVIFIAPEFTSYQKGSIGFKDLRIELWETRLSEGNYISFSQIKPPETQESISTVTKSESVKKVIKKLSIDYEREVLGKDKKLLTLYKSLKEMINEIDDQIEEYSTNYYMGFRYAGDWRVIFDIKARSGKLEIELTRSKPEDYKDPEKKISYMENSVKYYNQHQSHFYLKDEKELNYAIFLLKQAIERFKKEFR